MALSPRMLALVQKLDAADAKHFAGLRESARQEAGPIVREPWNVAVPLTKAR